MGGLPVRGAVVRFPLARLQKFTGVGRLRGDAAAELIRRLNIFKFIFFLAPGVDAEHPEEDEHVERDGQRYQREDHAAVRSDAEEPRVVDAVIDFQLLRGAGQYLVGRLGPRRERRELGRVGLGREAPLREQRPVWKAKCVRSRPCVAYYWLISTLMPTRPSGCFFSLEEALRPSA